MAKRFTDTDKWKKPFIRSMKAPYKLLWLYILDECDHAGIWQVDFDVAQIKIGEKLNKETALIFFKGRVLELNDGDKWFVYDFIEFQYGILNPANRAHNSVINILSKYKIDLENKPLISPLQGAMDMDMVKDKVKDKYSPANFLISLGFDDKLVSEWFEVRKKKSLTNTETAMNEFVNEVTKTNKDKNEVLKTCVIKSWGGFNHKWMINQEPEIKQPKRRQFDLEQ